MTTGVEALRAKRAEILNRREAIISAAIRENRGLHPADKAADNSLAAEARVLGDTISRAEELQRARFDAADRPRVEVRTPARPKGHLFAACLASIAGAEYGRKRGFGPTNPVQFAEEQLHDFHAAAAMNASSVSGGGGLIPEDVSADFIEALHARTVIRAAGCRVEPMPRGNLDLSGVSVSPVVTWTTEEQVVNAAAATFRQDKLLAKEMRVFCPISSTIVRHAGEQGVANIREDILRAMAAAEDVAFLRGTGTAGTPLGLTKRAGATAASAATPTIPSVSSETAAAIEALLNANSRMIAPTWAWAPRTTLALGSQRSPALAAADGLGKRAWPEIGRGMFRGYPFFDTTAIPTNLGGGGIDSEIVFFDAADVVIGQGQLVVRLATQSLYTDSSGVTQSAWERDETLMDIVQYVDLGIRHTGSVYFLSAVEYVPGM